MRSDDIPNAFDNYFQKIDIALLKTLNIGNVVRYLIATRCRVVQCCVPIILWVTERNQITLSPPL